jgi:hypothetical protein
MVTYFLTIELQLKDVMSKLATLTRGNPGQVRLNPR